MPPAMRDEEGLAGVDDAAHGRGPPEARVALVVGSLGVDAAEVRAPRRQSTRVHPGRVAGRKQQPPLATREVYVEIVRHVAMDGRQGSALSDPDLGPEV